MSKINNSEKINFPQSTCSNTLTSTNNSHGSTQFKPNTTVAVVVSYQDKFLIVEERDNNKVVYNQPAGHLESNESLINAIKRELKEETGVIALPEHLCGIYYYYSEAINIYYLRFCFVIELTSLPNTQPEDDDIVACHWFTLAEIKAKSAQLRSPLVLECIEDYLSGKKIPLSHLKSNL